MWIDVQQRRFLVGNPDDFASTFSVEKDAISTAVVEILWRAIETLLPI
jgi:hypothetical protein